MSRFNSEITAAHLASLPVWCFVFNIDFNDAWSVKTVGPEVFYCPHYAKSLRIHVSYSIVFLVLGEGSASESDRMEKAVVLFLSTQAMAAGICVQHKN